MNIQLKETTTLIPAANLLPYYNYVLLKSQLHCHGNKEATHHLTNSNVSNQEADWSCLNHSTSW